MLRHSLYALLMTVVTLTPAAAKEEEAMLQALEPFMGEWMSLDGAARQTLQWGLDRRVAHNALYFRSEEGWKLVSEGAYYWDPGTGELGGFAIGIDMPVSHFNIIGRPQADGLVWENMAYTPDGEPIRSIEEWRQPSPGEFTYELFRIDGEKRSPWLRGHWRKVDAAP